eukprot:3282227-Amphidinium_carterae.1
MRMYSTGKERKKGDRCCWKGGVRSPKPPTDPRIPGDLFGVGVCGGVLRDAACCASHSHFGTSSDYHAAAQNAQACNDVHRAKRVALGSR